MKNFLLSLRTLITVSVLTLSSSRSFSQISVVSTNGYAVNINAQPTAILPATNNCTWGYNYNVRVNYTVTFSGTNIPSSLYTLQGTVGCGSSSNFFSLPTSGGSGNVNTSSNSWRNVSDCRTATITSLGCSIINITISGPGISTRTVSFPVAAPLGVSLLNFTAAVQNNRVQLDWATVTETNNNYFTVERSADGNRWEEIKKVNGAGNSNSLINYQSYDNAPLTGTSYYRLKQTDVDGSVTYSSTVTVKYSTNAMGIINVFPIPNAGNTITVTGISNYSNYQLTVLNQSGSRICTTSLSTSKVDLPALSAGLYFIRVSNSSTGEAQNLRYVKL